MLLLNFMVCRAVRAAPTKLACVIFMRNLTFSAISANCRDCPKISKILVYYIQWCQLSTVFQCSTVGKIHWASSKYLWDQFLVWKGALLRLFMFNFVSLFVLNLPLVFYTKDTLSILYTSFYLNGTITTL